MQISPMGDLFQFSFAGVGRYHFRLNNGISLVPFMGIGLIHADLDRGTGPESIDRNDTCWYIPIGVSLEYQAAHNQTFSSTLTVISTTSTFLRRYRRMTIQALPAVWFPLRPLVGRWGNPSLRSRPPPPTTKFTAAHVK